MTLKTLATSLLIAALALVAVTVWRVSAREAAAEAAFPPTGKFVTVNGKRLDFARVLMARKEDVMAAAQLRRLAELPDRVAADSTYRREAAVLLARIVIRGATP